MTIKDLQEVIESESGSTKAAEYNSIFNIQILVKLLILRISSNHDVDMDHHNRMKGLVSLGLCFTVSLVLMLVSVLSLTDMNMVLAVDMSDAPMTKDTITAGSDGDDEDQGDSDLEDAPVTQDTITAGGGSEDDDDEDNSGQNNNDNNDNESATEIKDAPNCPAGQERALFDAACKSTSQINDCGNDAALLNPSFGNNCLNR